VREILYIYLYIYGLGCASKTVAAVYALINVLLRGTLCMIALQAKVVQGSGVFSRICGRYSMLLSCAGNALE